MSEIVVVGIEVALRCRWVISAPLWNCTYASYEDSGQIAMMSCSAGLPLLTCEPPEEMRPWDGFQFLEVVGSDSFPDVRLLI